MEPGQRPAFKPLEAGAVLTGTTATGIAIGAALGWAAGSVGIGALVGAVVGIPAGVFAVYRRFRGYFM